MSTRNDILEAIKTEIENTIKPGNESTEGYAYKTKPVEVCRGVLDSKSFDYYPVLCYVLIRDEVLQQEFLNDKVRNLVVWIYGYEDTDAYSSRTADYNPIHDLVEDVEKFFLHDFTNDARWVILQDLELLEGGVTQPVSMFIYEINIHYENQI